MIFFLIVEFEYLEQLEHSHEHEQPDGVPIKLVDQTDPLQLDVAIAIGLTIPYEECDDILNFYRYY